MNQDTMLWIVAVYLLSVIITNYALDNMLNKLTGRERDYHNIRSASKFVKVIAYVPIVNSMYALVWCFQFCRGYFKKR